MDMRFAPDDTMVWFEVRENTRFKWQWWGWKKVDENPVPLWRVREFCMIAMGPWVKQGVQYRARPARNYAPTSEPYAGKTLGL